jgi:hypothetical protein
MLRYKLRTLLMMLALAPPILAAGFWTFEKWQSPTYYFEIAPSGEIVRIVESSSGRLLAEHRVGHISFADP